MPRKSRAKKAQPESPATEPTPIAAVLEESPAMEAIRASREAKERIEQEYPLPDPALQLPAPEPKQAEPQAPAKPRWTDRFKSMRSYPQEGVRMVESLDHSRVGIAFDNDKPPTSDEKLAMQFPDESRRDHGFAYDKKPKVWEQAASPESRDAAIKLADTIAQRRREESERER
ncbi:hypothetical protein [Tautonia marina]|uniref:hypothetical protein n=1 Tax=Tautonia marina TaxID=2653855 RepID=UPI001260DE8C|nr:hypothetical protein [Tautonia marina]